MIQILLHSSKTMRPPESAQLPLGTPRLLGDAQHLVDTMRVTSPDVVARLMKLSNAKAHEVQQLYANWSANPKQQTPAIDTFVGDIYSGLQAQTWSDDDRHDAHQRLLILSGLYGALRACDGVMPYRLEMGYKLPDGSSIYQFWGRRIAQLIAPATASIVNLSAVEYTKAVLPYADLPVITPKFLTLSPKTGGPTFVTVHTKIARGAFARWMIQQRVEDVAQLRNFADLGYRYKPTLSTPEQPVFVCQTFQGLGLSVRLT